MSWATTKRAGRLSGKTGRVQTLLKSLYSGNASGGSRRSRSSPKASTPGRSQPRCLSSVSLIDEPEKLWCMVSRVLGPRWRNPPSSRKLLCHLRHAPWRCCLDIAQGSSSRRQLKVPTYVDRSRTLIPPPSRPGRLRSAARSTRSCARAGRRRRNRETTSDVVQRRLLQPPVTSASMCAVAPLILSHEAVHALHRADHDADVISLDREHVGRAGSHESQTSSYREEIARRRPGPVSTCG